MIFSRKIGNKLCNPPCYTKTRLNDTTNLYAISSVVFDDTATIHAGFDVLIEEATSKPGKQQKHQRIVGHEQVEAVYELLESWVGVIGPTTEQHVADHVRHGCRDQLFHVERTTLFHTWASTPLLPGKRWEELLPNFVVRTISSSLLHTVVVPAPLLPSTNGKRNAPNCTIHH